MEYPKRIEEILHAFSLNQTALAKKLNVSRGIVSEFASGAREPSKEFMFGLSKLGISIDWFLTGKGKMLVDVSAQDETKSKTVLLPDGEAKPATVANLPDALSRPAQEASLIPALRQRRPVSLEGLADECPPECLDDHDLSGARLAGARSLEMSGDPSAEDADVVDFYSGQLIGAGPAQEVEDYQPITPQKILRRFINPWRPDQVKALEARGDSMTKIGLFDRDIVLFVPSEREGDGIFVISIENRMQVKRLEFDLLGKTLRIISENDRYEPRILTSEDEIRMVKIEGKVVGWLHRHPY